MITFRKQGERQLSEWVEDYALSHPIEAATAQHYRCSVRVMATYAGQPLTSATVCDRLVNGAMVAMQAAGKSPDYIRSVRGGVLAIWRDLAEAGHCDPPRKIRSVRSVVTEPDVWTMEEVSLLVTSAESLKGQFRTLPLCRRTYWATLIRAAWDSALRRKDLHRLTMKEIRAREFKWRQHKTKKLVKVRLRPSTVELITAWGRTEEEAPLWPLWGCDNSFRQDWQRIVFKSGIPYGPFKRLRKSAGTDAENNEPGTGQYLLGNTRAVFERSYLNSLCVMPSMPRELP